MSTDRKLGLNRLISISTISLLLLSPYFSHSHKVSLSSLSLSVCLSLSSLSHTIFLSLPSTLSVSPSLCPSFSLSLSFPLSIFLYLSLFILHFDLPVNQYLTLSTTLRIKVIVVSTFICKSSDELPRVLCFFPTLAAHYKVEMKK